MKQDAEVWKAAFPVPDKFRPQLDEEDGIEIATVITRGISYYYTTKVFIKRQPHQDELGMDIYGN